MKPKTKPSPAPVKETESPPVDVVQPAMPEKTFISSDIVVTGDVMSEGELSIEGVIKGNVRSFVIIVGAQGRIEGDLIGDSITVQGTVMGNIRGVEVKLHDGSEVQGNILHEKLYVENGAMFEGQIRRANSNTDDVSAQKMAGIAPQNKCAVDPAPNPGAGAAQKKTAKKPSTTSSDNVPPMIIKDVAMIMGGENGTKK